MKRYPDATNESRDVVLTELRNKSQDTLALLGSTKLPLELINATIYDLTKNGKVKYKNRVYNLTIS